MDGSSCLLMHDCTCKHGSSRMFVGECVRVIIANCFQSFTVETDCYVVLLFAIHNDAHALL
jgi:hypothetical protein